MLNPTPLSSEEAPVAANTHLCAGPLRMILHDGEIRRITLDGLEIVRRVYCAVRDEAWRTPPVTLTDVRLRAMETSFQLECEYRAKAGDVDVAWRVFVEGSEEGTITWRFKGRALSEFLCNRIGCCVLQPIVEYSNKSCRAEHSDGHDTLFRFPAAIAPQPMISDVTRLTCEVDDGVEVDLRMTGDAFEMEDQRNWTDASFKTYSRPLSLPHPFLVRSGESIEQSVQLIVRERVQSQVSVQRDSEPVLLSLDPASQTRLPKLGLGLGYAGIKLTPEQTGLLRALNLAHLRWDLPDTDDDLESLVPSVCEYSKNLDAALEIAVRPDTSFSRMERIVRLLRASGATVCRWLLFLDRRECSGLRGALESGAVWDVVVGTNKEFVEINRRREIMTSGKRICFSINPQVHATDDFTLIENLPAQGWAVRQARKLSGGLPVHVSPVTLKPRFNPHVTDWPEYDTPDREGDPRQQTLFGACWTVGSLKSLLDTGPASVTYYEASGPGGVMPCDQNRDSALVYPTFHVFADVGEFRAEAAVCVTSSKPCDMDALALSSGDRLRLLVANFQERTLTARINLTRRAGSLNVKILDRSTLHLATHDPAAFRAQGAQLLNLAGDVLEIPLAPHAIARFDAVLGK